MLTNILQIILIALLTFLITIILYFYIKLKIFAKKNADTFNLSKFYNEYHADNVDTPRSISSMEPVAAPDIQKDYPNLNINELKSNAEKAILNILMAVEAKNTTYLSGYNPKIIAFTNTKINNNKNKTIKYEDIKFHRTAINRYIKETSTIIFVTTYEYTLISNKKKTKIQDRIKTEYTYNKSRSYKNQYTLGLNCPNCGATITDELHHKCEYCGATALDIETSPWQLNNIRED